MQRQCSTYDDCKCLEMINGKLKQAVPKCDIK